MIAELYDKDGKQVDWSLKDDALPDVLSFNDHVYVRSPVLDMRPAIMACAGSEIVAIYREVSQ